MTGSSTKVSEPHIERLHVVILGAGASLAALPNGDNRGRKLPLMNDLIELVELGSVLDDHNVDYRGKNFEVVYSAMGQEERLDDVTKLVEDAVYNYFHDLELPDYPTIYDHLVLSLRPKDFIATFNWDPFLVQAIERNYSVLTQTSPPNVAFLHGCTQIVYCDRHSPAVIQSETKRCGKCGEPAKRTRLLYPVSQKDYNSDPHAKMTWADMELAMQNANILTVFGYGAPNTDVEAMSLLKRGWGDSKSRSFEQTEIIDRPGRDREELESTWAPFIHTHHYHILDDFYHSLLARNTRRSCDTFWDRMRMCKLVKDLPIPPDLDFPDLWDWSAVLIEEELEYDAKRADKKDSAC